MAEILTVLVVAVITLYLATRGKKESHPRFTIVRKDLQQIDSEEDQAIYNMLTANGYYVSSRIQSGSVIIPLALEPYRIALLTGSVNPVNRVLLKFYLKNSGWKVASVSSSNPEQSLKVISRLTTGSKESRESLSAPEQKPS
ncbi:hypothetical protein CR205_01500 [Alteribacter lacisalsi]|uniref:Uncharacterized protein n=1 Tax=Alteribacter lacisalsi TaxID=2045244 RepID=A0A2W0HIK5_9BACI|nr:hypothetical protein [Alteribacter lacisalsi]PYZ97305.1 hypothetical protein CR205_01500 [Alteribacter lacisalsi]